VVEKAERPVKPDSKEKGIQGISRLLGHPDEDDGAEINVHVRVGYKTVLLVVVVFDFVHLSIREIYSAGWFEQLLGLS